MTALEPRTLIGTIHAQGIDSITDETQILCSTCGEVQAATEFYVAAARSRIARTGKPRGGTMHCRSCHSVYAHDYRAPRVALIDAATARGCTDCGLVNLEHPEIFDFDHVREGKAKPVSNYLTSGTLEELAEEIARCEVVCSNCHRIRTRSRVSGKRGKNYS